jgi:hypothetical protein
MVRTARAFWHAPCFQLVEHARGETMLGLGVVGTIIVILLILWLLGVIG